MRANYKLFGLPAFLSLPMAVNADALRIATWNLGWHVSRQELSPWIALLDHCPVVTEIEF